MDVSEPRKVNPKIHVMNCAEGIKFSTSFASAWDARKCQSPTTSRQKVAEKLYQWIRHRSWKGGNWTYTTEHPCQKNKNVEMIPHFNFSKHEPGEQQDQVRTRLHYIDLDWKQEMQIEFPPQEAEFAQSTFSYYLSFRWRLDQTYWL